MLGALLVVLHPPDVSPWPRDPADVEAHVWAAAIRHVSRGEARVEVVDTTLRGRSEGSDLAEVRRLESFAARQGLVAPPMLLRAYAEAPSARREVREVLGMTGKYRMVRVGTDREWYAMHDMPHRRFLVPELLVGVGRVTLSADGRMALVQTATGCPGICGEGQLLLLRRDKDGWRVIGSAHLWSA